MASFLGEIKRRKVFQVAVAYAVVAWLLVQVITAIEAPLNLPDWFDTAVIVLLAIGFPVAIILAWAFDLTPQAITVSSDAATTDATVQPTALRFGYISQALILLAVGFLVIDQYVLEPRDETPAQITTVSDSSPGLTRRYSIILGPAEMETGAALSAEIALSPDGRTLVYSVQTDGRRQLYLRDLEQGTTQALPDTEGALGPFFFNDEWIVFGADRRLNRVSVRGGESQPLSDFDIGNYTAVSRASNDSIIFSAPNSANVRRLHRVAALGGTAEPLDTESEGFVFSHRWPDVLPGGGHLLYTISPVGDTAAQDGQIAVLSLQTGESRTLIEDAYNGRFVPTGHIVFMRSATLWAVPFDVERLELTGLEVPVVNGVHTNSDSGVAAYSFSDEGLLAYLPGGDTTASVRSLAWVDRQGREEPIPAEPKSYRHPRLSPTDEQRLAISVRERGNEDIWILDLESGIPTRLTSNPAVDHSPLWTPDGKFIIFHSERDGGGMFRAAADGSGQVERLTTGEDRQYPETFSPDGEYLVFRQDDQSLYVLSMSDPMDYRPLIDNPYPEHFGAISPDGRWIAYESHENGPGVIYVRPFPNVEDGTWPVPRDRAAEPRWNPQGGEIFFGVFSEGEMLAVQVKAEPSLSIGMVTPLPVEDFVRGALNDKPNYDVSADGERLLIMKNAERAGVVADQTVLTVVENWFEELKRLAPPSDAE